MKAVVKTNFQLPGQESKYTGKVRDVYSLNSGYIVMVATDRISAFDVVLPEGIPYKGQMLNQIAAKFLDVIDSDGSPNTTPQWNALRLYSAENNSTLYNYVNLITIDLG